MKTETRTQWHKREGTLKEFTVFCRTGEATYATLSSLSEAQASGHAEDRTAVIQ